MLYTGNPYWALVGFDFNFAPMATLEEERDELFALAAPIESEKSRVLREMKDMTKEQRLLVLSCSAEYSRALLQVYAAAAAAQQGVVKWEEEINRFSKEWAVEHDC
jgi:hypothetical protein